jgi:autotransporter-associated beta strand protein
MGNPSSNLTVLAGGTLQLFNDTSVPHNFTKQFIFNGNGTNNTVSNDNGSHTFNGTMTLNGICIIGGNGTSITNNCVISGSGSLTKSGTSSLVLTTNETYTGDTVVSGGSLILPGNISLNNSTNVTVLGNGILDVTGRTNSTFTVNANRTLSGTGTIAGSLSNAPGSSLLLGTSNAVGTLTVNSNAYLNGATYVKLNASVTNNDLLNVSGNLVLKGTLNVTNIAGNLAGGQSYKLFNAATYTTNYTAIVPSTPGPNMIWDATMLASNGTLAIISTGPGTFSSKPTVLSFGLIGANVVLSGTNGQAGDAYYLLTSTNVALPLAQWTVTATNVLGSVGANGSFTFTGTNVIVPADQQQFYILSSTNLNHP